MKILHINATKRRQTTYHIGKMLTDTLTTSEDTLTTLFLPDAMPHYCVGCGQCFEKGENFCPHREYTAVVAALLDAADVLVFTSPVYVMHTTGQLKTLLDHFGYRFMIHRPKGEMFKNRRWPLLQRQVRGCGLPPRILPTV